MLYRRARDADTGTEMIEVARTGFALINDPLLNKGIAFSASERDSLNLVGLLPPHYADLPEQVALAYEAYATHETPLARHIYLRSLQDSNETLFYALLGEHLRELLPIIYTPVVGEACQRFSHIYRHPRGVFVAYPDRDKIDRILVHQHFDGVQVIVVSDGERILGLGDQGAGGMGIPIGKLSLYSACAGIHPASTLPILLDAGTDNPERLRDPFYIGWRHERVRGADYDAFVDAFVTAVRRRFPHVVLQFEDFAQQNAYRLLERHRDQLCTFNDDIQGTAAVAAATLFSSIVVTGTRFRDQRVVILGAGSAGCGISELLVRAMVHDGLPEREARGRFFLVDRAGPLIEGMTGLLPFQERLVQPRAVFAAWRRAPSGPITFEEVVRHVRPTVLIGVSGQPALFTEPIVREMAAHVERPVIFPLSNPTNRAEARPADLLEWTGGRALIGTGSPFPEVTKNGRSFRIDQTNNSYIFPGVGLGLVAVQAQRVTDAMFMAAARALADCAPARSDPQGNLLPPLTSIRDVSLRVACAVAAEARAAGLAAVTEGEVEDHVRRMMWTPQYLPYRRWEA